MHEEDHLGVVIDSGEGVGQIAGVADALAWSALAFASFSAGTDAHADDGDGLFHAGVVSDFGVSHSSSRPMSCFSVRGRIRHGLVSAHRSAHRSACVVSRARRSPRSTL